MSKLVYKPLEPLTKVQIEEQLKRGNEEELILLPLSVGEYAENWKETQDVCLKLMEHNNPAIRANAALGLAYIARNHRIVAIKRTEITQIIIPGASLLATGNFLRC